MPMQRSFPALAAVAICAVLTLAGCGSANVEEPWISGDQYDSERQRSDTLAGSLNERLRRVQQDR
jgi:hypothetical protein